MLAVNFAFKLVPQRVARFTSARSEGSVIERRATGSGGPPLGFQHRDVRGRLLPRTRAFSTYRLNAVIVQMSRDGHLHQRLKAKSPFGRGAPPLADER